MIKGKNEEVKLWKTRAEESLKDAIYLLDGRRYGAACFFSQQSIEKLLKALIIKKGKVHPKVHDLLKLTKEAEVEADKDKIVKLKLLTRHYWQVRYPDINKKFYTKKTTAEEAVKDTKELFLWLDKIF